MFFRLQKPQKVTDLNPVSDPLVVGLVLQESVQLFTHLFSTEELFPPNFLWLHFFIYSELDFLKESMVYKCVWLDFRKR